MSLLPSFSVDPELSEALVHLEREFLGVEVEVDASATGGASDSELLSPTVSSGEESEEELDYRFLEEEFDVNAAAAEYFDEDHAPAEDDAPQAAAAPAAQPTIDCGCRKKCLDKFDAGEVLQMQLNFAEMEKSEMDLLVLGLLESSKYSVDTTTRGSKRKKQWYKYTFQGEEICPGGFRCLYNVGVKQFKNLKKHLEENGPVPRVHGNTGKKPKHALTYPVVCAVVTFLKNYTDIFGIPQPAPLHGRAGTAPTYLPASNTVADIHKSYVSSCSETNVQAVGYHSFRSIWRQCLPFIQIMSPRTDVCPRCEACRRNIHQSRTEFEKTTACDVFKAHVDAAQAERDYYRKATLDAKAEIEAYAGPPSTDEPCSSSLRSVHYTFDFAQNVALPQAARQEGPLYFKAPRKVHIFGVNNEAYPLQVNYLLDEADTIGADGKTSHGPNAVISMLHHYFAKHGMQEEGCHLHCDNCSGQNKNRSVVAYLCWRVLMGLHRRIELSFMLTGHTRCLVDGCFGLIKQKFRKADVYTMEQLATLVNNSATCNKAQLIPGSGMEWRPWDAFLAHHFKPVKGIREVHHMVFDAAHPGIVAYKTALDGEVKNATVLTSSKDALAAAGLPEVLPPGGLSLQRQQYLYRSIRQHVPEEFQDQLCPMPATLEPAATAPPSPLAVATATTAATAPADDAVQLAAIEQE